MGEAGRAKAPEYSWERVTDRIVDYYYEVLASVGASAG
jgi:glycosyltransferase involved in cell wall biosynthesis